MSEKWYVSVWLIFVLVPNGNGYGFFNTNVSKNYTYDLHLISASYDTTCDRTNIYKLYNSFTCNNGSNTKDNRCCHSSANCSDKQHRNHVDLTCTPTLLHGDILTVQSCHPEYPRKEIIENCRTTDETKLLNDFLLSLPVTTMENITYRNVFCAVCNFENSFLIWHAALDCKVERRRNNDSWIKEEFGAEIDAYLLVENLRVDGLRKGLVSKVNDSIFECKLHGYLPYTWTDSVERCGPNVRNRTCSVCGQSDVCDGTEIPYENFVAVDLQSAYLPRSRNDLYKSLLSDNLVDEWVGRNLEHCCVRKTMKINQDFQYKNNDTVHVKEYDMQYGHDEWAHTLDNDFIYVCGTTNPRSKIERFLIALNKSIVLYMSKFSIFFLFLMIAMNLSKKKLQSLPNKVVFSFSITLLATYIVSRFVPCTKLVAVVIHYLYLSYYTWLLIAAYDCWYVICYLSCKMRKTTRKEHLTRYLVYCLLGWVSPLAAMAALLYMELSTTGIRQSRLLEIGYREKGLCLIDQKKPSHKFFAYPCTAICCSIIALFAFTSLYIYLVKRRNIYSTAQNVYYKLFVKLALTLGITWAQCFFYMYTRIVWVNTIFLTMTSCHGIFMFLAYGFEIEMLRGMGRKLETSYSLLRSKISNADVAQVANSLET